MTQSNVDLKLYDNRQINVEMTIIGSEFTLLLDTCLIIGVVVMLLLCLLQ